MVAEGTFREDLYYRINVIHLEVPPLRERREDIIPLSHEFLTRFSIINDKNIVQIDHEVYTLFFSYAWPGNIRELENVIERGVVLATGDTLVRSDLPSSLLGTSGIQTQTSQQPSLLSARDNAEKQFIEQELSRHRLSYG